MTCDLEKVFGELANGVPSSPTANVNFIFSAEILPVSPTQMVTDRLLIRKATHSYNDYDLRDALWFYAHKNTYRNLALLILSVIFHSELPRVQIEITHPKSDIKYLVIEFEHIALDDCVGYLTRPYGFNYFPQEIERHPWYYQHHFNSSLDDLPCFYLASSKGHPLTDADWKNRDMVRGFGRDQSSVAFAELLLNVSRPENKVDEIDLEGEGGFRGVGIHSTEVKLNLPESLGWIDSDWEHLES